MQDIPFPRKKLEAEQNKLATKRRESIEKMVDIRFLDKELLKKKKQPGLKGWTSSKLKSLYISTYKQEWLKYLKVTPKGTISFDREARDKFISIFPDDKVLQSVYEPLNMKTAMQQISKLLE